MKWHLDFNIPQFPFEIHYQDKIFAIGSCFAENLSQWLEERHFNVLSNPSGVLFNPMSILSTLNACMYFPKYTNEKFIFFDKQDNCYKSFLHQLDIFTQDKQTLFNHIYQIEEKAHHFLQTTQYLFITFGSAFVYEHKEHQIIVANCHKQPSQLFELKLLSVDEIVNAYSTFIQKFRQFNPNVKIVFSVSPVKYLAYGLINNTMSKSTLILAVHRLCKEFSDVYYFPAYEWIVDDLRDYRFYKEDMAHPNEMAIRYVMKKFSDTMLSEHSKLLVQKMEIVLQAMQHKLRFKESESTKTFAKNLLKQCEEIEQHFQGIELKKEKAYFLSLLQD